MATCRAASAPGVSCRVGDMYCPPVVSPVIDLAPREIQAGALARERVRRVAMTDGEPIVLPRGSRVEALYRPWYASIGRSAHAGRCLARSPTTSRPLVLMDAVRYGRDEVVLWWLVAASSHRARVAPVVGRGPAPLAVFPVPAVVAPAARSSRRIASRSGGQTTQSERHLSKARARRGVVLVAALAAVARIRDTLER